MTRYHKIDSCNQDNGEGMRTVIWFSGCPHHCKACFSPQTWHPKSGMHYDSKAHIEVLNYLQEPFCDGLTLLGGEPLAPYNIVAASDLAMEAKGMGKTVWCYTGYSYETVYPLEIMKYIDVLVDGRFILKQFNPNLKWRGSANQRVIDVKATRELDEYDMLGEPVIVLHKDNNTVDKFVPEQAFNPMEGMTPQEIKAKYIDKPCKMGEY